MQYTFEIMHEGIFTLGGPEGPIFVQISRKLNPVGTMTYVTKVFHMIGLGINLKKKHLQMQNLGCTNLA